MHRRCSKIKKLLREKICPPDKGQKNSWIEAIIESKYNASMYNFNSSFTLNYVGFSITIAH